VADDSDDYAAAERAMQLVDLRWHWGDAYEITWAGEFRAVRRDNGLVLRAETADELRTLIRRDYIRRPVPRRPQRTPADRERRPGPYALEPRPPA
jgi:hypothetical protein